MFTLPSSLSALTVCVCVSLSLSLSLLALCSDSGLALIQIAESGCCCEAVGGWPGQHEDFGWVVRLDVVHSSSSSHPRPRVSAVCQAHFPLEVNIASAQCYRTLECQLGVRPSYMWFSIIPWNIES